jgi:hypothetical protein
VRAVVVGVVVGRVGLLSFMASPHQWTFHQSLQFCAGGRPERHVEIQRKSKQFPRRPGAKVLPLRRLRQQGANVSAFTIRITPEDAQSGDTLDSLAGGHFSRCKGRCRCSGHTADSREQLHLYARYKTDASYREHRPITLHGGPRPNALTL